VDRLFNEIVWVRFTFSDKSEFCFQTTLNDDILRRRGIVLEENCLPRLDKTYFYDGGKIYRQFPFDVAESVVICDNLEYTDNRSRLLHQYM